MNIFFLLLYSLAFPNNTDTLQLPIKNGIVGPSNAYLHRTNKSVLIAPQNDFDVRTCLAGKIEGVIKGEGGYFIGVKTDSIITIYSLLDSVKVALNDSVKKGDVIGWKDKRSDDNSIIFSVYISGKEVEAVDYLVRSSPH
ncbi:MAG: hypothetical protein KF860_17600 [Cyclobacteriaceae bacterium]|nr:hypothetical protein [Cyclobacteriaceae bacterium]